MWTEESQRVGHSWETNRTDAWKNGSKQEPSGLWKTFFFGKSTILIGVIFSFQCSRLEDIFHVCFPQDILFAKAWKHIDGIQDNYTQIWNLDILNLLAEGVWENSRNRKVTVTSSLLYLLQQVSKPWCERCPHLYPKERSILYLWRQRDSEKKIQTGNAVDP